MLVHKQNLKFARFSASKRARFWAQAGKQFKNPLDPLLLRLSKDYLSEADLATRLGDLFRVRGGQEPTAHRENLRHHRTRRLDSGLVCTLLLSPQTVAVAVPGPIRAGLHAL